MFVVLSQLRIASAIVQSTYIALLGSVALGAVRWRSDRGVGMSLNTCAVRPTARAKRSRTRSSRTCSWSKGRARQQAETAKNKVPDGDALAAPTRR